MEQPDLIDLATAILTGWLPKDQLEQLEEIVAAASAEGYECDVRTLALARCLTPEKPAHP